MNYFLNDYNLAFLAIFDVVIVYMFCGLQITYNILTAKYILKSRCKINGLQLWRAFLFSLAPIVYSLLPILLVLYFYKPDNVVDVNSNFPGLDFALKLIWIHLPPIILVYLCIITWLLILLFHNKRINSFLFLEQQKLSNDENLIKQWDIKTKVIFRKIIYKWYIKTVNSIMEIKSSRDKKQLLKILAKIEGWYIAKQRFQFFWCTKKAYHWIKQYYATHYLTLRYFAQQVLLEITSETSQTNTN